MIQPTPDDQHVCKPGATTYYCPTAGEVESDCHGGFDVCCARPDLHLPVTGTDPTIGEIQAAARTRGLRLSIEAEDESPAGLRDRYAEAIARCDYEIGLSSNGVPRPHHEGQAAAVMAVRDEEMVRLRAKVTEADRVINWHTTCAACASTLESAYEETRRADTAEAALNACRDRYATSASNAMTELAARDAELAAARSTIDRVQSLADWLASHAGHGIHLEADGIRRGIADRLRDALGEQPADTAEHCTHYVDQHNRHHQHTTVTGCPWCAARDTKTETDHA